MKHAHTHPYTHTRTHTHITDHRHGEPIPTMYVGQRFKYDEHCIIYYY